MATGSSSSTPTILNISLPPSPPRDVQPKVRKLAAIGDAAQRAHSDPTEIRRVPENPVAFVPIQPCEARGDQGGAIVLRNQETAVARVRRQVVRTRTDPEGLEVLRVEELAAARERQIISLGRAALTEIGTEFAHEVGAAQSEMLQLRDQEHRAELQLRFQASQAAANQVEIAAHVRLEQVRGALAMQAVQANAEAGVSAMKNMAEHYAQQ